MLCYFCSLGSKTLPPCTPNPQTQLNTYMHTYSHAYVLTRSRLRTHTRASAPCIDCASIDYCMCTCVLVSELSRLQNEGTPFFLLRLKALTPATQRRSRRSMAMWCSSQRFTSRTPIFPQPARTRTSRGGTQCRDGLAALYV